MIVRLGTRWSRTVDRVSLLWRRFTPLEEFLLAVLQREFPAEPRRINQTRIDSISRVIRPLDWTEIMFYGGKGNEESLFPCQSHQDIVLATIRFSPEQMSETWTSKIYAVSGHMFSIVTRPSPKGISFCKSYALRKVQLVDDPMQKNPASVLERLQKRLPSDFDRFAGKTVFGWSVFEKDAVYNVFVAEGDYLLIAERDGQASYLGVAAEGPRDIWYLPHDASVAKAGSTVEEAINNYKETI